MPFLLLTRTDLMPIAVGIFTFQGLESSTSTQLLAAALPDLGRACDRSLAGSSADDPERDDNTAIDTARLQTVGYHGQGWWRYVLPGLGLLDWAKFPRQARCARHHDVISVEHEDAEFGWPRGNLDLCKDGETQALRYLERTLATL